jgi:hypothetical protein
MLPLLGFFSRTIASDGTLKSLDARPFARFIPTFALREMSLN